MTSDSSSVTTCAGQAACASRPPLDGGEVFAHRIQLVDGRARLQQQGCRLLLVLQRQPFGRRDQQRRAAARQQADQQCLPVGGARHFQDAFRARLAGCVRHRVRGFHLADDVQRQRVTVLDDDQAGGNARAEQRLDRLRHARRGLAGADHDDAFKRSQIVARAGHMQAILFDAYELPHRVIRIDGGERGKKHPDHLSGALAGQQLQHRLVPAARAGELRPEQSGHGDARIVAAVLVPHQHRAIHRLQHLQIVQAVAQPDAFDLAELLLVKRLQQADGTPLVVPAHDVEDASLRPAQAVRLDRAQKALVGCALEHEGLVEIALPGQRSRIVRQPGQRGHFLDRHVGKTARFCAEPLTQFDKVPADFSIGHAERNEPVAARFHGIACVGEVAARNEYPAAVFADERMAVVQLHADGFHFRARLAGTENQRDALRPDQAQGRQRRREGIRRGVEQRPVQIGDDDGLWHI